MSTWSPFAKAKTDLVPLPEGNSVTIQKLGWKALEAAAMETQRKAIALAKEVGPGGLLKELSNQGGEQAVKDKVEADPFLSLDKQTLLERGIKSWTLSEKPTPEEIADLDKDIAVMLARAIYELSKPATKEEQKNA